MNKNTILSFLLSAAIVGGALWVAERSMTKPVAFSAVSNAPPLPQTPSAAPPESPKTVPARTRTEIVQDAQPRSGALSKCTIQGKTVYSDTNCPVGSKAEKIALHETAGIVSPAREALEDWAAKRHAQERNEEIITQKIVAANGPQTTKSDECQWLSERIDTLDARARQPQTGQMQDWIKDQRRGARDRQYALRC